MRQNMFPMFLSLDKKCFRWEKCRNISVASKQYSLNNRSQKGIRKVIETINNKEKGEYIGIFTTGGDGCGKRAQKWWGGSNARLGRGGGFWVKKHKTELLWLGYRHAMCNGGGQWWCEVVGVSQGHSNGGGAVRLQTQGQGVGLGQKPENEHLMLSFRRATQNGGVEQ